VRVEDGGPFGWVRNDEACDGSVWLECHSGSMLWTSSKSRVELPGGLGSGSSQTS
jgi:hypothetical protein